MSYKVVLGIDYGEARIGLAIGDTELKIATPLTTIDARKGDPIEVIRKIVEERKVELIVMGFPLLLSGKEGRLATLVREFAERLRRELGIEVILKDERFTSIMAEDHLRQTGRKPSRAKSKVDMLAARIILQEYLDSL